MLNLSQVVKAARKVAKDNGHNDIIRADFAADQRVRLTCYDCKNSVWIDHNAAKTIAAVGDYDGFKCPCVPV